MHQSQKKLITTIIVSLLSLAGLGSLGTLAIGNQSLSSLNWQSILDAFNSSKITSTSNSTQQISNKVEKVYVQRSIDGDTIELSDGRKVRFLSMDTPETVKPNTPVMCYGPEAKAVSKNLVEHKTIYISFDKEKVDRYNRDLRFLYLNETDARNQDYLKSVNAELVREGLARSISYSPNTLAKKDFDALMQKAQSQKLGLWGKCPKPFEQ